MTLRPNNLITQQVERMRNLNCLINFNPLFRKINVITVICGRYIRGRFRFIPPDYLA